MTPTSPPSPPRPERRVLERLAASALPVAGVDHAAVAWVGSGTVLAIGASDTTALVLTEHQVRAGVGPIPDALAGRPAQAMDLGEGSVDRQLADLAASHGVLAAAAHPVEREGVIIGVVALYRHGPAPSDREAAEAGVADVVARTARALARYSGSAAGRTTVELAAEVVARTLGISAIEALVVLRDQAYQHEAALEDVAAGVLDGSSPLVDARG